MSAGKLAVLIVLALVVVCAIDYARSAVAPPPAGTGCMVTFNSAGQAVVVCTSGLKMTCRP